MNDQSFSTLVETLPAGLVLLESSNGGYSLLYMNAGAATILGCDSRQFVGQAFSSIFPEYADNWLEALRSGDAAVDVLGPRDGQVFSLTSFQPAPGQFAILIHDVSARCDFGNPSMPASMLRSGLGEGRRILLVEDHPVNRMLATRILESAGFEVEPAVDGLAALDAFTQTRIDLVLMDCNMPRMDGLEATRRLRALEGELGLSPVPILALTAHSGPVEQAACMAAGMDGFMGKPYTAFDLLEMVERHLAQSPAQAVGEESSAGGQVGADDGGAVVLTEDDLASLDMTLIDELRDALGDDLNEIVDQFLFQLDEQVRLLGDAITCRDAQQVREYAHALKGSAGNLGVSGLAAIAAEIEVMGREDNLACAENSFARMDRCVARTVTVLEEMGFSAREG